MAEAQRDKQEAIQDFADYVSPSRAKLYVDMGFDFVPGRREGSRVWDLDGSRSFINCHASVFNLGHRPPRMVAALKEALERLDIGDYVLMSEARARLARRLAELTPGDITYSMFLPCGSEAVDVAIKLARGYTGRPSIVSAVGAYHGLTGLAMAAGDPHFRERCGPVAPGFSQVPFGDVEAVASAIDGSTAAVIMETIPSTAGILIPPPDYYPRLRDVCDRAGALLIIDEVQAGLARTGRLWAIDEWGVVPDIFVLGKAMSGGVYPMSATCYRRKLQAFFDVDPFVHASTFGGADVGCAVTMAVLDQITEPAFLAHVNEMARRFEDGLARLRERHANVVVEVRQRGLMIGLEMVSSSCGPLLTQALARRGVLALFADNRPSTLMIKPPLIITAEEVDEVLGALEQALPEVAGALAAAKASEGG